MCITLLMLRCACVGLEYELLLVEQLKAAGVTWLWTEAELRAQGYCKTPDVRMQVRACVTVIWFCHSALGSGGR
jgi:hypothetical protein